MSKLSLLAAAAAFSLAGAAYAQEAAAPATAAAPAAPAAPAAAAATKVTTASTMRAIMGDAKAKEVLAKHAPQIAQAYPEYEAMIGDLPLTDLAQIAEAQDAGLTADAMKAIEADFGKL